MKISAEFAKVMHDIIDLVKYRDESTQIAAHETVDNHTDTAIPDPVSPAQDVTDHV